MVFGLRIWAAAVAVAAAVCGGGAIPAQASAQNAPPLEAYGALPAIEYLELSPSGDRPHARVRCGSSGAQEAEAEEEAAACCAGPGALRLLWVCVLLHAKPYFGRPLLLVFELGVSAAIAAFLGILYFADFYEGPIPVDQQQLCPGHLQALCPNAKTSCRP